jgi:hypothetical protein
VLDDLDVALGADSISSSSEDEEVLEIGLILGVGEVLEFVVIGVFLDIDLVTIPILDMPKSSSGSLSLFPQLFIMSPNVVL